MAHEVMKPCNLCGFPTDEATLWVNYKFCKELVCVSCMHKRNIAKRRAGLTRKYQQSPDERIYFSSLTSVDSQVKEQA